MSHARFHIFATAILLSIGGASMAQVSDSAPVAAPAKDAKVSAGGAELSGKIAWYGRKFSGRKTASGARFNPEALTMAHKTLAFGTRVKITNLQNNRSVVVRVNDRGPSSPALVGDVSHAAARTLGMLHSGVTNAKLEVVGEPGKRNKKP